MCWTQPNMCFIAFRVRQRAVRAISFLFSGRWDLSAPAVTTVASSRWSRTVEPSGEVEGIVSPPRLQGHGDSGCASTIISSGARPCLANFCSFWYCFACFLARLPCLRRGEHTTSIAESARYRSGKKGLQEKANLNTGGCASQKWDIRVYAHAHNTEATMQLHVHHVSFFHGCVCVSHSSHNTLPMILILMYRGHRACASHPPRLTRKRSHPSMGP